MLINQQAQYLGFIASYKNGNRFLPGTNEFNQIQQLEQIYTTTTKQLREAQGLNVPSLTFVESVQGTKPSPKPGATEGTFTISTPTITNIGLPPGTTPMDITTITTPGATSKLSDFFNTYKTPLLIGGAVIGFLLIKKFKK
jgi:hypothetical protein